MMTSSSESLPRCVNPEKLDSLRFDDEGCETHTSVEQKRVEEMVASLFKCISELKEYDPDSKEPIFFWEKHMNYLRRGLLQQLPQSYQCLDASRPWLVYWIIHSLSLLNNYSILKDDNEKRIIEFLQKCVNESTGGYGGGPGQLAHLATTYAAVNALVTLCSEDALESIDRPKLRNFLKSLKQPDGSFTMHRDGEVDVRGVYCAVSSAYLSGIASPSLFENTADWVLKCQTYEGGFAGSPGGEAHGGYTFCALAALAILGQAHRCDIQALLRWAVNRQTRFEGGFAGRTNKLVDGCYSFWQGALFPIIQIILKQKNPEMSPLSTPLFDPLALQEYLIVCCQDNSGGMRDKPKKSRDFYHTCYDLSGLSVAQHSLPLSEGKILNINPSGICELNPVHPFFNVTLESYYFAKDYFSDPKRQLTPVD